MEQNKEVKSSKPIINTRTKLYRKYDSRECKPLPRGVMPNSNTSHERLAYLDKGPANTPLSALKEMWNK